jgi:hypothetical protein
MKAFFEQRIEKYLEEVGSDVELKVTNTPFVDEKTVTDDETKQEGALADSCSSILMKFLYGARVARWDLLPIIGLLASMVSKWNAACDRMLYKMVCWVFSSLDLKLCIKVYGDVDSWYIEIQSDADLATCPFTRRSTSGVLGLIKGHLTLAPVAANSTKQGATSEATPEAELIAASKVVRTIGIPLVDLLEVVLQRPVKCIAKEDNTATIQVIEKGWSPSMRHMKRVHAVSIARLNEVYCQDPMKQTFSLEYEKGSTLAADALTKPFVKPKEWEEAIQKLGLYREADFKVGDYTCVVARL